MGYTKMRMKLVALLASVSWAALPPGYEDKAWCPEGSCLRQIEPEDGRVGASKMFNECFNPDKGLVSDEVWTGSKSTETVPSDWSSRQCTKEESLKPTMIAG